MKDLSNVELIEKVKRLAAAGCRVEAELLEHLAEVNQRRLYLDEGCPSMFAYCTEVLHFSEAASSNRIVVVALTICTQPRRTTASRGWRRCDVSRDTLHREP